MKFETHQTENGVQVQLHQTRFERYSPWIAASISSIAVAAGVWGALSSPESSVEEIGISDELVLLDREADLPEIYTGELVDLDGDDTADLALFGDPADPTIKDLKTGSSDRSSIYVALLVGGSGVLGAIVGPIATAYAKKTWGGTDDE